MSHSPFARLIGDEPLDRAALRSMAAAAWHKSGVVCFLDLGEVRDPIIREGIRQEIERQFGRRDSHGE